MNSQADGLRARVQSADRHAATAGAPASERAGAAQQVQLARTIAVGSGKGGVGKSTIALALAWAAAERGVKTALIDADLGLANQDILCGVQPVRTAADWLAGRAKLAECFTRLAPRLWLLPGASGVARLADLHGQQRQRLLQGLAQVAAHVELMIVDLGAGLGAGTMDVASAADRLLVVCTPEPTSLADAYGFIKACARRGRTDRVMLAMNMSHDDAQTELAAARLCATCARFLKVKVECVGAVPQDVAVRDVVIARRPLLMYAPTSHVARVLRGLEGRVSGVAVEGTAQREPPAGFLARLAQSLGLGGALGDVRVAGVLPARDSPGRPGGGPRIAPAQ